MVYDLIIIGAGPAGLTASIYSSRYKINHLIIGKPFSSLITEAPVVENYPGFLSISGFELIQGFVNQVKSYGVKILEEEVRKINPKLEIRNQKQNPNLKFKFFKIITSSGKKFETKSLIISSGTERKKLNIPGEKEFFGRGVSYCAICDGPLFKNKIIGVVGGSDAALSTASFLTQYASKVYLIYRQNYFRAEKIWQEKIEKERKIISLFETNIIEIKGREKLEKVILDREYQGQKELPLDGLIIEIGSKPLSKLAKNLGIELDEQGSIKIKADGSTNIKGIFAAGDITTGSNKFRQVITACAEGAIAALGVYNYLKNNF